MPNCRKLNAALREEFRFFGVIDSLLGRESTQPETAGCCVEERSPAERVRKIFQVMIQYLPINAKAKMAMQARYL